jgi:Lrp/AsnC family leucine-responsive transcriptional regulator
VIRAHSSQAGYVLKFEVSSATLKNEVLIGCQEGIRLKDTELRLIRALITDSRKSDRELAKKIGVSQPTVSRIRERLEKGGYIEYTGVPNLEKLGFEILAMTFANWKNQHYPDTRTSAAKKFIMNHPNLIFVSSGSGMSSDRVAISVHKDYSDYSKFMSEVKSEWGEFMNVIGTFVVSLVGNIPLRSLTFKYLADCLLTKMS